jgi:hypothetical protein
MKSFKLAALLALAALWTAPAEAQDPPVRRDAQVRPAELTLSPAARQALRDRIIRRRAIEVQPAPPAEATETPAPVTPVEPAPAEAPTVEVAKPLKLGDLRYIKLEQNDEKQSADMVKQSLPLTFRDKAAVFQGVVQTVDKNEQELILKAVAFPGMPLRRNAATGKFEGGVSVGVIEVGGGQTRALSAPIAFQVIGEVATEPDMVSVPQTAPPYRMIKIVADTPEPEVKVTVVSNVAPAGEELILKVRPSLALKVTPSSIQGWGLETAEVLVSAQSLKADHDRTVQLSSTLGRLSANTTALDAGGMAQVTVRSESTGSGQITVGAAGLDGATTTVAYVFPWRFLGAALVGGVVGGLLRKRSRSRSTGAFAKSMGIAVLAAAVVVALYVLGINLVGFALPTHGGEVLVFVVAALGALYGTKLLTPEAKP